MTLHPAILVKHVLRWRLVHHKAVSLIVIFVRDWLAIQLVGVGLFLIEGVNNPHGFMPFVFLVHERSHEILVPLREIPVLLIHVTCVWICLMARHRALGRLFARDLDRRLPIQALVGQMLLVQHSQALEILICFEYFVPVYFLEVNLLYAVLTVRVMSDDRLKSARVDAAHLPDHSYEFILVFILRYDHVGRRVMLFVAHEDVRYQWTLTWKEGYRHFNGFAVPVF
jgi:hypothetical protein